MGWIFGNKFKSVETGGKRGGSYNITNGTIVHPAKGSGKKSPKVRGRTTFGKTPKK